MDTQAGHTASLHGESPTPEGLVVDCATCTVRGDACTDCVVTFLIGPPPELRWQDEEERAVAVLADAGLIPPLRLVTALDSKQGTPRSTHRKAPGRTDSDEHPNRSVM